MLKKCRFPDTKWFDLGLRLGLLKTTLDAIKQENIFLMSDRLRECLSKWLSKADNVITMSGPPSFDSLSDALRAINEISVSENSELLYHCYI